MKKTTVVFGFLLVSITTVSQRRNNSNIVDSILNEGKLLYRLEMASWHSTDIILKNHRELTSNIGGYFSYECNDLLQCIFFSRSAEPKVIATIVFDTLLNSATAKKYIYSRELNHHEQRLYNIRQQALNEISCDTLFVRYSNSSFNLIPVADSFSGKVYVLTEPEVNGIVIFGNDYLLQFNNRDSLLAKQKLHSEMIPVEFGQATDPELRETFHVHNKEEGKYVTPTDICTLMLFQKFSRWKRHVILSPTHVCAWDIENNELTVHTSREWSKNNNNKKRVDVDF